RVEIEILVFVDRESARRMKNAVGYPRESTGVASEKPATALFEPDGAGTATDAAARTNSAAIELHATEIVEGAETDGRSGRSRKSGGRATRCSYQATNTINPHSSHPNATPARCSSTAFDTAAGSSQPMAPMRSGASRLVINERPSCRSHVCTGMLNPCFGACACARP